MRYFFGTHKKGFSLIELIVVIAISAVLLAVMLPNLLSARERARDAKRKQESNELKNALRLFYADHQSYPAADAFGGGVGKMNYIVGCGPADVLVRCPCVYGTTSVDFATGTTCEHVYMKRFPSEFGSNIINYHQLAGGDDFCIDAQLENAGDPDTYDNLVTQGKTPCSACASYCSGTKYCVCAD
jgi:prepilin-type N-terminal cleavage/methylation domain-containing protein